LFGELARDARAQRLAPLERATGERPLAHVRAPDQQPAPVRGARGRGDADDRPAKQVARGLFQDRERRRGDSESCHRIDTPWNSVGRFSTSHAREPRRARHPSRTRPPAESEFRLFETDLKPSAVLSRKAVAAGALGRIATVNMLTLRHFNVIPRLPPNLERLRDLAHNLWWSWAPVGQDLFIRLDPDLWEAVHGNPIEL